MKVVSIRFNKTLTSPDKYTAFVFSLSSEINVKFLYSDGSFLHELTIKMN